MSDYLVTNTELSDIADAIRAKGGTSSLLTFPNGFTTAIAAIPTGITPTGTKQISISQNGTTTEDVTNYANAQITVAVPQPSGTISITQNGIVDVTNYASADVSVSGGGGSTTTVEFVGFQGDYYYIDPSTGVIQTVTIPSALTTVTVTVPSGSMFVLLWLSAKNPDFSATNMTIAYSVGMGTRANFRFVDFYLVS